MVMAGCGHMTTGGARTAGHDVHGRRVSEAELQSDLERFTSGFFTRLGQAVDPSVMPTDPNLQQAMFKLVLGYGSSALDIATGKAPGVDLLDMVVFVSLARHSFEGYWQPKVFGALGKPVLDTLQKSELEIWQVSSKVLTPEHQSQLRALLADWQRDNPDQTRVAFTRMPQFAQLAGRAATRDTTTGMLSSVESATRVGDQAVSLGERAMFLAQHAPFLMRLQVRIGAREVMSDGVAVLSHQDELLDRSDGLLRRASELLTRADRLGPMLSDLETLTQHAEVVTQEAQRLTTSLDGLAGRFEPLLAPRPGPTGAPITGIEAVLTSSNELTARTLTLLRETRGMLPSGQRDDPWQAVQTQLDRTVRRWLAYLALVGIVWATFFWAGYYLVRRRADRRAPRHPPPRHRGHPRPSSVM